MKRMKFLKLSMLFSIVSIGAVSCSESATEKNKEKEVINEGVFPVENGKGEIDTIPFKCYGCKENLTYKLFEDVMKESSKQAKEGLNNPLSFVPVKMEIYVTNQDSLFSFETGEKIDSVLNIINNYEYIGKNAYGTEMGGEQIISFTLVDGTVKDISEDIKLDELKFNDELINRSLSIYDKNEFIRFTPTLKKSLIVVSSLSCVDENATFMVTLENDEDVNLKSWNDFNCDGNAYFDWYSKSQIEKLKEHKMKYLFISSRNNSVMIRVPKNESDYMQKLIDLYEK